MRIARAYDGQTRVVRLTAGHGVLVSGFGDDGRGGLFAFDGDRVDAIDPVATTGLAYHRGRLARLLRAPGELTSVAELLVSDARGVVAYRRLDEVVDPHDVLGVEDGWLVVSTGTNEIVRVGADGVVPIWKDASDARDATHLNCVTIAASGDLWATAFGRFSTFKGWRGAHGRGRGVLWNLRTGAEIGGLTHPHTPRQIGGDWIVCESLLETVTRRDAAGAIVAQRALGGYTRGLAVVNDLLLVGVSVKRNSGGTTAQIAVLELDSLVERERIEVPCAELYDLVLVPTDVIEGARVGFGTNAYRFTQAGAIVGALEGPRPPAGARLDPKRVACRVVVALPAELRAGEYRDLDVEIRNRGSEWLGSVEPHPVFVASRWIGAEGVQIDGDRVPVPWVLRPGAAATTRVPLRAPEAPGAYRCSVSLVQEGEFWLDDLDPANGASAAVRVAPG